MAHTTTTDVQEYLMRPLSPEEEAAATRYLNLVEIIIRREIPDLETRLSDPNFEEVLEYVSATIVSDIMRNPERLQYEQAGDYAYSLQQLMKVDSLRSAISDDMWWMLGVRRTNAFTIETAVWNESNRRPRWWSPTEKA